MVKFTELIGQEASPCSRGELVYSVPWIEKYRPKKLSQVIHQTEVVKMLENVLETGNLPHLLLYGPPGTGKTSTILAIGKELFGPKKFRERVIELNASDERGIGIVRTKITSNAKMSISEGDSDYKCPPYKIIVLDEADAMTTEAQSALRKVMENTSKITRFCFICNYINQIISPIRSRCVKFRFKPINNTSMASKLTWIAQTENVVISPEAIGAIIENSNGDLRKGIMFLQNLSYLRKNIDTNDIYNIINIIPKDQLTSTLARTIEPTSTVLELSNITRSLIKEGYPLDNLLKQLNEFVVHHDQISSNAKARICMDLSIINKDLVDCADEYLQLLKTFVNIKMYVQQFPKTY